MSKQMREILFRGKSVDNGEWAYGNLAIKTNGVSIITPDDTPLGKYGQVIPETVGQYTGLTDKNGKKIFEGDIVEGMAYSDKWIGVIVWIKKIAAFGLHRKHDIAWENCSILKRAAQGMNDEFTAEIIGNIHDNSELLDKGK